MAKKDEERGSLNRLGRQFVCYILLVLINIVLNRLVTRLGLPLYIDNVGTLLAAFLGGYLPGIFVGYATNIINATADPTNAYYAGISVLIAVSGAFLARRGAKEKLSKALLSIPVFAFIGGFLGSVLTYLMYGFGMGEGISAPFAIKLLQKGSLSVFWAQMISDVSIDLVDKAITVLIVFIIIDDYKPEKKAKKSRKQEYYEEDEQQENFGEIQEQPRGINKSDYDPQATKVLNLDEIKRMRSKPNTKGKHF